MNCLYRDWLKACALYCCHDVHYMLRCPAQPRQGLPICPSLHCSKARSLSARQPMSIYLSQHAPSIERRRTCAFQQYITSVQHNPKLSYQQYTQMIFTPGNKTKVHEAALYQEKWGNFIYTGHCLSLNTDGCMSIIVTAMMSYFRLLFHKHIV